MKKVIIEPGTYFLSDPGYAVPNDSWDELLNSCDYFKCSSVGTVNKDGKEYKVLGFSTAYGDGVYLGSDSVNYGVDSGLIGLTPIELCTDADFNVDLGTVVTFTTPTVCTNDNGNMSFGDIAIDTDEMEYEEDETYYDEDEE